ncbi:MAG: ASCH domain-containing protein [Mariprofundaceae bacterium]|nr:ASCH domain-containing protein [Mariprofundaceae bacterium]
MSSFPEKTCDISRLVTHAKLVAAVLADKKTEQRRDGVYAYPNEVFELEGISFVVTSLKQQRLGDMTDRDAQAEGYPSLAMYKGLILSMHKNMTWNEDDLVWVHTFARQTPSK